MRATTVSDLRENIKSYFDEVEENLDYIVVSRPKSKKRGVIVMSIEEFEGWKETMHLYSTPENASRVSETLADYQKQNFKKRTIEIPDGES